MEFVSLWWIECLEYKQLCSGGLDFVHMVFMPVPVLVPCWYHVGVLCQLPYVTGKILPFRII